MKDRIFEPNPSQIICMRFFSVENLVAAMAGALFSYLLLRIRKSMITTTTRTPIPKQPTKRVQTGVNGNESARDNDEDDRVNLNGESYKMVILVRTDLSMGKGKVAAQCCHAALSAYKEAAQRSVLFLREWEADGQAKVALKVQSEDELNDLLSQAKKQRLVSVSVRDAGRTQVASGTKTVGAIGPAPAKLIDCITGHLSLY